jgi:hypothetical protein
MLARHPGKSHDEVLVLSILCHGDEDSPSQAVHAHVCNWEKLWPSARRTPKAPSPLPPSALLRPML